MFLKQCKYIEKKVVRHINDNLNDFFHSDESDKENFLEWAKFFVRQLQLNLKTPRGLPVIQKLQILIR